LLKGCIFNPIYIGFYLGRELETGLKRNMVKFQMETQNPTHGPCWTSVSHFTIQ